ncbi:bifunctional heptose 7-phosphate kinase/heptose 1-phosphate adenyltransferase [Victivallis sp.]|uniref:bifunctional heptose 7-phosphate kinase/heptose 1-phosphate adenyltransferase n=1 Tax=Victivallis sp. TaxID=2049020 RepID=UPI003A9165B7
MSATKFHAILSHFPECRIAVLGDMMLDVYLWGKVTRISPEAPVPVVNVNRRTSCLGGAANVMRNVATLNAHAHAFGTVGNDPTADELLASLAEYRIRCDAVERDPSRRTTEKRRVIAGAQQLCREDYEDVHPVDDAIRRRMVNRIVDQIRNGELDAVIFEDYRKGMLAEWMLEEVVAEARRAKVVTALDPKPGSMKPVRGITVMKPNRVEAFALAGVEDGPGGDPATDAALCEAAARLMESWQPEHLLISLAAQGMALYDRSLRPQVIPTRAREVFDVSGAGDTVTATFALSLVSGATPVEAAELANLAAGVVVGKMGTVPVRFEELEAVLPE